MVKRGHTSDWLWKAWVKLWKFASSSCIKVLDDISSTYTVLGLCSLILHRDSVRVASKVTLLYQLLATMK